MKIGNLVNNFYLNRSKVSFGTTERNSDTGYQCTYFDRGDIKYGDLASDLAVDITAPTGINYEACSDCSEVYTLALVFSKQEEGGKFLPVQCSDANQGVIDQAKTGIIGISSRDRAFLEGVVAPERLDEYFTELDPAAHPPEPSYGGEELYPQYQVSPSLKEKLDFQPVGDVVERVAARRDIQDITAIRNVSPYLTQNERLQLVKDLVHKPPGSIVIFGQTEMGTAMPHILKSKGYKHLTQYGTGRGVSPVYKKPVS